MLNSFQSKVGFTVNEQLKRLGIGQNRKLHRIRQVSKVAIYTGTFALVAAACGSGSSASTSTTSSSASSTSVATKTLTPLTLITFPGTYYFTDVVAQSQGFFKDHGLAVKFVKPQAGTSALQLLLSGSVDGLINDGALSVLPAAKGQDIKIIGSIYNRNAWKIYVSDKLTGLPSQSAGFPALIQALKGKTIGVTSIGAGTDLALQSVLIAAGMNPETDVHRVGIGLLQAAVGQFQAGRIDAYVFNAPAGSVLGASHLAHEYFDFATQAPKDFADVPQGTLITSGSWLKTHTSTAKEWIAAEEEALKWIEQPGNLNTAGALYASSYGGTTAAGVTTVKSLVTDVYPYTLPGLKVPQSLFNNEVNLLVKVGLLKSGVASYSNIVASFAQGG